MKTRDKIIGFEDVPALLNGGAWRVVVGRFDPLTADEVKRLTAAMNGNNSLLAVVLDEPGALLCGEFRTTLVAALRNVSAVVLSTGDEWRRRLPQELMSAVIEDPEGDARRTREFIDLVLKKAVGA